MAEKMKIIMMSINDIFPYENNPRRNERAVDAVANSIKKFGFKNPIIVDKNNIIISGHTRRLAAIKLGLTEVPVIISKDMSEEQIKSFRLVDNRVAEFATWDKELLKKEMQGINMDLSDFGFDKQAIKDLKMDAFEIKQHKCPRCGGEFTGRE